MPFDTTTREAGVTETLYRERREGAAAVWRRVPVQVFGMNKWECGTKACALGWLAHERYDGWAWFSDTDDSRSPRAPNGLRAYEGAARYFGMSVAQAHACFGGSRPTAKFYGRWFAARITPTEVADVILTLPYYHWHQSACSAG